MDVFQQRNIAVPRGFFFVISFLAVTALPISTVFAQTITNSDVTLSDGDYPDATDYTFAAGVGNNGKLILAPPTTGIPKLTGDLTLERDATLQFEGEFGSAQIVADSGKNLDLNGNRLVLLNNSTNASSLNLFIGDMAGGGTFAAGASGTLDICGADPVNPLNQETIVHLNGGQSNNNGSNIAFELTGGGLSVDNPLSLPETTTLVSKYGAGVILPTDGTTVGSGFTYQVDSDGGAYTNIGGMMLLGDGSTATPNIVYNGVITYNGTNFVDNYDQAWGAASIIVGSGNIQFANTTFAASNALAVGGGRNFLSGELEDTAAVLVATSQENLNSLPGNLGLCGGKIDVSALGASVDLRNFTLAAISVDTGDGEAFPGGGSLIVNGDTDVVVQVKGDQLLTRDGILKIEQNGSATGSVTIEVDCGGGDVDPGDFAGFLLPAGAEVHFVNVSGDTVAAGNLEGAGSVNADGKNLAVGSNVSTTATPFTGTLQNVNSLQKTGSGKTEFGAGANVTAQAASINQGELAVQQGATFTVGGGTGTLAVESGGVLSGNGTVQGEVVLRGGGWLKPGNSIDVHTTGGNLTIEPSGGVEIEIRDLGGGQNVGAPGTDNDLEHVTGTINVGGGGTILVTEDSTSTGNFKSGDKYYALVGEQGINNIQEATVTDNIAGFAIGGYGLENTTFNVGGSDIAGQWFWFDLVRGFDANTPNARAVSDYLIAQYDTGRMVALFNALDALSGPRQATALGQLSGEPLASSQSLGINSSMVFTQMLLNQIRPGLRSGGSGRTYAAGDFATPGNMLVRAQCDNGDCVMPACGCAAPTGWATGYGVGGTFFGDGRTSLSSVSVGGVLVGLERGTVDGSKAGLFFNYGHTYGDTTDLNAATRIDDHYFGAYLVGRRLESYWLATFGFGYDRYDITRHVGAGALNESPRTTHDGWQSMVYGEWGWDLATRYVAIQPLVGLQYLYLREDGFREDDAGAPSTGLTVDGMDYDALRTHLGLRLVRALSLGGTAEFRSIWIHELLRDTAPLAGARFSTVPGGATFPIQGADLGRDWCWLGTGLKWRLGNHTRLFAEYDLLFNIRQSIHTGSGGVEFSW